MEHIKDIYLTPELKEYYMKDFNENVLTCQHESWRLDAAVADLLIQINDNSHIQSLYSKCCGRPVFTSDGNESYLEFAYSKEFEAKIIEDFQGILAKYVSQKYQKCTLELSAPKENSNWRFNDVESPIKMACLTDKNYFMINHFEITFQGSTPDKHLQFWDDLVQTLHLIK